MELLLVLPFHRLNSQCLARNKRRITKENTVITRQVQVVDSYSKETNLELISAKARLM